jgi:predicted dienelactone hydrolase
MYQTRDHYLIIPFGLFVLLHLPQTTIAQKQMIRPLENVAMMMREFADSTRSNWLGTGPRPLRVIIWYPGNGEGTPEEVSDTGQFTKPITIFHDGPLSSSMKQYPLVILSHGSGGNALQMRWIGYYLSMYGYIAVSINHNGTSTEERQTGMLTLSDFCIWERPRDISVVVDRMLADPMFRNRIDPDKIGAAGFSLGGASVIWVAGARLNLESLRNNSPSLPPDLVEPVRQQIELSKNDPLIQQSLLRAEHSFKDDRIKGVFAFSPAIGYGFTEDGLKDVKVPVRIVAGDADVITPVAINAQHYATYITGSALTVLAGEGGHFTRGDHHGVELEGVSKLALGFFDRTFNIKIQR